MIVKTLTISLLLVAILVFATNAASAQKRCQPAKHAKLPVITGLTYRRARPKLLAAGWQPHQTISANKVRTDPNMAWGNGQLFWNKGFRELEGCAGTGVVPCAFLFKDAYGNKLRVTTAGEESPKDKFYARVTGYKFVCDK